MFNKRRADVQVTAQNPDFVQRLKHLTVILLQNFKTFSPGSKTKESQQDREKLDDYITKLQSVESVEPLEELEARIKNLIYSQREAENLRNAERLSALQRLIAAAAGSLSELAGDSESFATELNDHLKGLEAFASYDEFQEFRGALEQEIGKLRHLVANKQKRERALTETLQNRVKVLEEQLVVANEELVIDALTQVYNRGAFDTRLEEDIRHNTSYGGSFSLLLLDIDHFKNVNDSHGHLVGDRVLRAVAKTAKHVFRIDDFVARYGGEEFAVILYDTGLMYASRAAERFRQVVAAQEFQYQQAGKSQKLRLTVSVGAARFHTGDTPECMLDRADKALYLAKNSGRNQVKTEDDLD